MIPEITAKYDWILALISIAFVGSCAGNGANDVGNSYATSVAARTLTMWQAGLLAVCTEFIGAVALGDRVTGTIKSGIISIDRFEGFPGPLMLAMACAEIGSAFWLLLATKLGFPVSTTQTVVGALVGVGFASQSSIHWEWKSGSVSQIAASWAIAPAIACGFSAIIFGIVKYTVLQRQGSFEAGMRLIPLYMAFTGGILALFIVVEAPTVGGDLEEFGAGKAVGIILGVFGGCLIFAYVFFLPYAQRRLTKQDPRIRFWHLPLGPLLWKNDPWVPFPGKETGLSHNSIGCPAESPAEGRLPAEKAALGPNDSISSLKSNLNNTDEEQHAAHVAYFPEQPMNPKHKRAVEPYERFIQPVRGMSWLAPAKYWGYIKYIVLQGVTREVVEHESQRLDAIHAHARVYDTRVEHLFTYCQVISAMMMSIAHGSNDVANAVGPWSAVYSTYLSGSVDVESKTPVWFLAIAGLLLGAGFWIYGYHIVRSLGNKITLMSPSRGYSVELGAAITVLLASRLGLPVSTTQCLVGASLGVALMNFDAAAVNWLQLVYIFAGWVLTLPCAGLVAGLLCLMALNTPHF